MRQTVRAYVLSIVVRRSLSLLAGWEFGIFDKQLNIDPSLADMLLLAESRAGSRSHC